ncbi:MAG: MBL fold metallo-hydrolase [Deltaproteobacteria bacterium]|nr:MBL fold metallo-hydrolase [Deltaproteobacteria bacterium]
MLVGDRNSYYTLGCRIDNTKNASPLLREIAMSAMNNSTPESIITIDCDYMFPLFAASYLMIEGDRAAFFETNTTHAAPRLLSALKEHRLEPDQVQYIVVTHIHLDHSGGATLLAKMCPNATILAHDKAAKHIIDPEKLIKGAIRVYGETEFQRLFGQINGIEARRVRIMEDGEKLRFGNRELEFIYTAGHAWHHFCIYDSETQGVFAGDSFGLGYPILNQGNPPFIFPSTSPIGFNPSEARKSIEKILNTGANRVYLTHYGVFEDVVKNAEILLGYIDDMEMILNKAIDSKLKGNALEKFCLREMTGFFEKELKLRGLEHAGLIKDLLKTDLDLNARGIALVAEQSQ